MRTLLHFHAFPGFVLAKNQASLLQMRKSYWKCLKREELFLPSQIG
ncbi:hypothetical protein NC652_019432 [Populus alba x Populus x berolinensis]|nr:hypothetical protein NC652_019432 [Populus alba x Populus x berolinensis]